MSFRNQDALSITGAKVGLSAIPTKRFADFFQKKFGKSLLYGACRGSDAGGGRPKGPEKTLTRRTFWPDGFTNRRKGRTFAFHYIR